MKPQNQTGAISVVLAVLFLAISAVGISFGLKAVNTPTNLLSKAATCASFNTVWQTPPSALNAGQDFTCNATLDPQFSNSRTIVCGWSKNGGWPQTQDGRWVGATCNGTNCSFGIRMDANIDPQASYDLVAFDNQSGCGPSNGKRVPLNVNRPNIPPTSPPQPTAPPGQPTQPPIGGTGRCFYLTAQFSLTGEGNYDASVNFNTDDTAVDYHDIQLQKNGVFVAGWNKWTRPSPFTYYPQWTGGRVNRGTSVTYSGIDDVCGLRGNRASISCTINNNGSVSGSGCSLAGGNPPQPTAAPTAIPTVPVGGPTLAPGKTPCNFVVKVTDNSGNVISGADVGDNTTSDIPHQRTDINGLVTFPNLDIYHPFNLWVTKDNYNEYTERVILADFCRINNNIQTVKLTPLVTPTSTPTPIPTPQPDTFNLTVILDNKLTTMYQNCDYKLSMSVLILIRDKNGRSVLDHTYTMNADEKILSNFSRTFYNIPLSTYNSKNHEIALLGYYKKLDGEFPVYLNQAQSFPETIPNQTITKNFTIDSTTVNSVHFNSIKGQCPFTSSTSAQDHSLQQKVAQTIRNIGNIGNIFNKNENIAVKAGAKGKVVVRNSLPTPIEVVYITLHRDQNDSEGFYNQKLTTNSKGVYLFNLENTGGQTANPLVKAWVRSTDGSWYQNRACKLSGDNFDCSIKAGDNKTLYVDIGPQGLQKLNSDMQKTSQTATENISKFLDTVPLGQYVKMFIISAF